MKKYKMSDSKMREIIEGLDDDAGFLIKESTFRYYIEKTVNEELHKPLNVMRRFFRTITVNIKLNKEE